MDLIQTTNINYWIILKVGVLAFLFIYVIFSFIVVRQTRLMTETLDVDFDKVINIVAMGHLIVSITIFVLSLFFL